jgi:menaquinone-dependent protoporphyrinogen oxidase
MRVLVTWSSKRGGTEGIGRILAEALGTRGFDVVARPAGQLQQLDTFDAVILGGALYANCWPADVRRFVNRHVSQLRKVPVWFFSSGPLDDSADRADIPPTRQVAVLAERIGAKGHVTFGGRLERNATGFPASSMAKTGSGDWRHPERIRGWTHRSWPQPRAIRERARNVAALRSHLLCLVDHWCRSLADARRRASAWYNVPMKR